MHRHVNLFVVFGACMLPRGVGHVIKKISVLLQLLRRLPLARSPEAVADNMEGADAAVETSFTVKMSPQYLEALGDGSGHTLVFIIVLIFVAVGFL